MHASAQSGCAVHSVTSTQRGIAWDRSEDRQGQGASHARLHGKRVAGMGAAVDDVEAGHGQDELLVPRQVGQVLVQRHALLGRTRLSKQRMQVSSGAVGCDISPPAHNREPGTSARLRLCHACLRRHACTIAAISVFSTAAECLTPPQINHIIDIAQAHPGMQCRIPLRCCAHHCTLHPRTLVLA